MRCSVAKVLGKETQEAAKEYLWPLQLGVACPLGTECAAHTARQWCERHKHEEDQVLLKLNFYHAFNKESRSEVLMQVKRHFPELSRWCQWCHGSHSHLQFGKWEVSSQARVQQGDPLGPLLFALVVHPLAKELPSRTDETALSLTEFYLDDGVLAGGAGAVAAALQLFHEKRPPLACS